MKMEKAIEMCDVTVRYGPVTALEKVTLTVEQAQIVGLLGANGSGKSSLFAALVGLVRPESGSVRLFAREITAARSTNLVAYVPQAELIDWDFPVSVRDVVAMGRYGQLGPTRRLRTSDQHAVDAALERVGLTSLHDRQIGQLSGGQRKRAFIARAISQDARLLLLDEPFAGVDTPTQAMIVSLLHELRSEGRTIVISTHDVTAVPTLCDRVILLQRHILFDGSPDEALQPQFLARTFHVPA